MCGHQCDCFCHRNSDIPCVRCTCQKCHVCEDHIFAGSLEHHTEHCHNMAQARVSVLGRRPPLADLVAVAA